VQAFPAPSSATETPAAGEREGFRPPAFSSARVGVVYVSIVRLMSLGRASDWASFGDTPLRDKFVMNVDRRE
jgi:hypothetical protein